MPRFPLPSSVAGVRVAIVSHSGPLIRLGPAQQGHEFRALSRAPRQVSKMLPSEPSCTRTRGRKQKGKEHSRRAHGAEVHLREEAVLRVQTCAWRWESRRIRRLLKWGCGISENGGFWKKHMVEMCMPEVLLVHATKISIC